MGDNKDSIGKAEELGMDELDAVVGAGPISNLANAVGQKVGTTVKFVSDQASKTADAVGNIASDVTGSGEAFLDGINDGLSGDNNGDTNSQEQK